jgi:hypothetical protein
MLNVDTLLKQTKQYHLLEAQKAALEEEIESIKQKIQDLIAGEKSELTTTCNSAETSPNQGLPTSPNAYPDKIRNYFEANAGRDIAMNELYEAFPEMHKHYIRVTVNRISRRKDANIKKAGDGRGVYRFSSK